MKDDVQRTQMAKY